MAEFRIDHRTRYEYSETVARCYNVAVIRPAHRNGQLCLSSELEILPRPSDIAMRRDFHGNERYHFSVMEEHRSLTIYSRSLVRTAPVSPAGRESYPGEYEGLYDDAELCEFLLPSPLVPVRRALARFARPFFREGVLAGCLEMSRYIRRNFQYKPGVTSIHTSVPETLRLRAGVCQDFAHLMIACCRSAGIPARYVSGYIETRPAPGQQRLLGADATHAWCSIYAPGQGWFDFDPTNGKARTDEYIETAVGRDFTDVSPMRGIVFGGGRPSLHVAVDVIRL